MNFSGERYIPTEQGTIRLEHYHRYAVCLDAVRGKTVLDIACGEGYGSFLLSDSAHTVLGVDISEEAIHHASSRYTKSNLRFVQGSASHLTLQDNSFDVVISFETIEHLTEQAAMLIELRRVLRPNGILIISTPNRPVYSEEGAEPNKFHVAELDYTLLDELLGSTFQKVIYFGQRMLMSSVIQPLNEKPSAASIWSDDGRELTQAAAKLRDPVYFIAMCGSSSADFPDIGMSALYPDSYDLLKHYVGFAKWAQSLEHVVHDRNEQLANLSTAAAERDEQIAVFRQIVTARDEQIAVLSEAVAERDKQIEAFRHIVTERDEHITALSGAITDRDDQIAAFRHNITERDEQITGLKNAITVRDVRTNDLAKALNVGDLRIADLTEALNGRDLRIVALTEALNVRDGRITDLTEAITVRDVRITDLTEAITVRDVRITDLTEAIAVCDERIANLTDETVRRGEWALALAADLQVERDKVTALVASRSWRLTRPLREARRWISCPMKQAERYAYGVLRSAKRLYQSLPLSMRTKARHRQWIARVCPQILLAAGSPPSTLPPILGSWKPSRVTTTQQASCAIKSRPVIAADIAISPANDPLVSVIIPIYGNVDYTLRCLRSLAAHSSLTTFEVIVVDDCSPDESSHILSEVTNIRVIRKQYNEGFIRSCNAGADAARGQYLHFLNNDTEVTAGWLDALVDTFKAFPRTGLVGSKLIYPDGRLQEAGGIIWRDGSAWNFGRLQDPQLPVFSYAREVDFCSGASIMIPAQLFKQIGGFDEHYLPAYCEDSDLALKLRHRGYRVIYQPLSTVIHHEGITSGTDTTQGVKSHQVVNTKKLFARWQQQLSLHQTSGTEVDNAKDRRATRRVLVLDHCTPTPDQDAGSVTTLNLMLLMREMNFQVTFIPEGNLLYMREYTSAIQARGVEVLYAPYLMSVDEHVRQHGSRYDLVFLFRAGVVERHLPSIRNHCPAAKVLFHTIDLHFLRMAREAELHKDQATEHLSTEMRRLELAAIQGCDASIVHSTAELSILRPMLPDAKLHLFPLILDVTPTQKGFAVRKDICFIGGYQHTPNVDAVLYFVKDILPRLRVRIPGIRFYVVGSNPPSELLSLRSEDVIVTGFVPDLKPLLDNVRLSVAPLRYGAGIKGKIGTSMALGLPVVATSIAAEGMLLTNDENILVADGAAAFADAIVRIYNDEQQWNRIRTGGLLFAEQTWGARAAYTILQKILLDLDIRVECPSYPLSLYSGQADACSQAHAEQLFPRPDDKAVLNCQELIGCGDQA